MLLIQRQDEVQAEGNHRGSVTEGDPKSVEAKPKYFGRQNGFKAITPQYVQQSTSTGNPLPET
eukprot:335568-Amorphochlora_amoeboformis.AAC.1